MTQLPAEEAPTETVPPPPARPASRMARLRQRVTDLSRSKHAFLAMMLVSVIDGSVFPIPPFAILVPMVLAEPKSWLRLALAGTVASLFGGAIGYGLGWLAMQGIASGFAIDTSIPIQFPALGIDTTLRGALTEQFWILALLCSILPTPYKVVAIGSGLVGVGVVEFALASVIGRSVRFFAVSMAFAFFGERARRWVKV
jgi:membrane protein YqaA with SNARE-associated domain